MSYFWVLLATTIIGTPVSLYLNFTNTHGIAFWLVLLATIPLAYVNLVAAIKRCHDTGHSGGLAWLLFVPLASFVLVLYLLFAKGMASANKFGPPPNGISQSLDRTPNDSEARYEPLTIERATYSPQHNPLPIPSSAEHQSPSHSINAKESTGAEGVTSVDEERLRDIEDQIYERVGREIETNNLEKGLWTRLFAECGGDEKLMQIEYIKQRAAKLIKASVEEMATQARAEQEREQTAQLLDSLTLTTEELAHGFYWHNIHYLKHDGQGSDFLAACKAGDLDNVLMFLRKNPLFLGVTDEDASNCLYIALQNQRYELAAFFLGVGVSPSDDNILSLSAAKLGEKLPWTSPLRAELDSAVQRERVRRETPSANFLARHRIKFDGEHYFFQSNKFDNFSDVIRALRKTTG